MRIDVYEVGAFQSNSFLIGGNDTETLMIDPGADAPRLVDAVHKTGHALAGILITHGHTDHISALADVLKAFAKTPVYMHPADASWAFGSFNQMPPYYTTPSLPRCALLPLTGEHDLKLAGLTIRILETPGHTPGGVCLYLPDAGVLFSGDTLFKGSVGRTDLQGGNARTLSASLKLLAALPDATRVYCGHGPSTTIGEEKRSNFFLARLPR